jgi:hypothetical protein
MFKCVLKSLSDTELVSVASEVTKPEIKTESIAAQLAAKSNSPIFIVEKTLDEVRMILTHEILAELSLRLLESDNG